MVKVNDCVIAGAGLSGLLAAQHLASSGFKVTVLEAAAQPGGRLATVVVDGAVSDSGAQYFTVRNPAFAAFVERWVEAGLVVQWSQGFAVPGATGVHDGHPRYRGAPGMQAIAAQLAAGLDVRLKAAVTAVRHAGDWEVETADGALTAGRALLLTPPAPLSLALLTAGNTPLPDEEAALLGRIEYEPCLALAVRLDGPSAVPAPGGLWPGGDILYWVADNQQKGLSAVPGLTLHATPEFSRAHFDAPAATITEAMLAAATPWLRNKVVSSELRRWRHSIPVQLYPGRTLVLTEPGPLAFAGDAFAGPRVEGAALSGLAAATAMEKILQEGGG